MRAKTNSLSYDIFNVILSNHEFKEEPLKHLSDCSKCLTRKTAFRPISIKVQLVSYQCQHGHKLANYQYQTQAQSLQLSMSTWTQACKLSMPTTEHDLVSYQCQHVHKLVNYQCPPLKMISSAINVNTDKS